MRYKYLYCEKAINTHWIYWNCNYISSSKAKLTGKITSTKNEALASVSLTLQSDKTQVSKTDIEGRYSFSIDVDKNYTLTLTYVGYKNKTVQDIKATTTGEELVVDVLLEEANSKLADVTVSANRSSNKGSTDNALISFQRIPIP